MPLIMLKIVIFSLYFTSALAYFTLPGKCPENIKLQDDFRLSQFYDTWYQTYFYSSDGQMKNNCSTINLILKNNVGVYLNQSRIDRGLFHRYSIGKINIPANIEDSANLEITFHFKNAPRRLKTRKYPFKILATNYNYYATVYTCEYSPLTNKHFIYVWILSRNPTLNDVSKELATKPLQQLGIDATKLAKDDHSTHCHPKYYDDVETEPMTFRYPVPI